MLARSQTFTEVEMNPFVGWRRKPRKSVARKPKWQATGLAFETLESRDLMAGIPQLSSLPGAAHTIFLDFDGHFQATWNRTDSNQSYSNVNAGEFNIDGAAGISDYESAAIRTIWETVSDDYAPFHVNVTTVAPASTTNMLRVVMAGSTSAVLRNASGTTMNIPTRDVFISTDAGAMVDTSGYAAISSYTNAEPNVVYVFAKYMSTWGTVDSEGRSRDLRLIIATTASHEAGHAFGLEHHGDYDTGNHITTPIMGSNVQGDRSIWSSYYSGGTLFDSKARLTNLLGPRQDDYTSALFVATEFPVTYSPIRGYSGTVKGVIGTSGDVDLFRLTTNAANTYQFTVSVPQFGNLDSQLVFYMVRGDIRYGYEYLEQVFVVDPAIPASNPYAGLGATITMQLPAGKWAVAVRGHGGYGDVGTYALSVSIPSSRIVYNPGTIGYYAMASESAPSTTYPATDNSNLALMKSSGAGMSESLSTPIVSNSPATTQKEMEVERTRKKAKQDAADAVFAFWPAS